MLFWMRSKTYMSKINLQSGHDLPSTPSDNLWKLIYLATEALRGSWLFWMYRRRINKSIYLSTYLSIYLIVLEVLMAVVQSIQLLNLIRSLSANSHTYYYLVTTHSLFHSRLKTFLFRKSFPLQPFISSSWIFTTWIPRTVHCYF